ncbi:MAG: crotonase/enoyl-CoA hydratase family protein [Alphaproteobacteria bacterium]|uniref:crotonase/enoyl-CoA hydratase family protein n=1 Tax=Hyphomonas sp. TaxID=87 RepID=UPI001DD5F5DA|nr:crotonase/enoyl-CoA hydratase family protein [Alphaproteobacteria bacterium]MBU2085517.1 crotonase/enoyl-CoA hydratase family protein [Alphaproteobacteria bacterium]MBU2143011.1 crotonase/enoyl-CoA hydratase family protein [Alphaproteobacteria bacterium]MBU2197414.1 crotonase/enoyl-CoA hydratase family protein [Alphaproteobacteria bacterium]
MSVEFETKGHLAIITLNRPDARNAINGMMAQGIESALDKFEEDPNLWVAILTANGKAFCAGADLKEISAGNGAALSTKKGGFAGIARRERTKPLIAAITGSALAGGTEIALSCDMIVCADTTNFGLPEVKRSLVAGAGGLFRLPRVIGMPMALEVILTGDPLSSQRAFELGMVNKVVPEADVMAEATSLADRIMANAPLAVQASRTVTVDALKKGDDELWKASGTAFAGLVTTEDFKEGPRAFIEKRAPVWKGK